MRQAAILFKNFGAADEKVRAFRGTLAAAGAGDLRDFQDGTELAGLLEKKKKTARSCIGALKEF